MTQSSSQRAQDNSDTEASINPYAGIIIDEAQRRGVTVDMVDPGRALFRLRHGERAILCHESLTERTHALALALCDDKSLTRQFLDEAGLPVPAQRVAGSNEENTAFLREHQAVVVKPVDGEQGAGVSVNITTVAELTKAIEAARRISSTVLLEAFVQGEDLRVIVIDNAVVAAAVRRSPAIVGDGDSKVSELIQQASKQRERATDGESHIPDDEETHRCIEAAGYHLDSVLPDGKRLVVREAHNLHVGGTIEDVTAQLHPRLRDYAVRAAQALDIPVVGVDFIAPTVDSDQCVIIELNERPGLANHEPQPTAQRFIDFLFPETAT